MLLVKKRIHNIYRNNLDWFQYGERKNKKRHLICYFDHPIANAQIDGFRIIAKKHPIWLDLHQWNQLNFDLLNASRAPEVIWLQTKWDTPKAEVKNLISKFRHFWTKTPVVYLDWFAPTDLRNAYIFELVDLYIKKNILVDVNLYQNGFHDTNLVEFESQWNKKFLIPKHKGLSEELLLQKLHLGWSFAINLRLVSELKRKRHLSDKRPINIHCRMAAPHPRTTWYTHMRGRSMDAVKKIKLNNIVAEVKKLKWKQYLKEINLSKLCFSPYGYGEVCWRDFEAVACGATLVKPDMGHLRSLPDLFIPFETYIPVKWDMSDLEEKCIYYVNNGTERLKISCAAHNKWSEYIESGHEMEWMDLQHKITKLKQL